ncbi:hypothetical protein ACHCAL_16900 [Providencia huaxiensis]|nr:hypothetical protein [Providencia alcalifaciens]
MMNHSTAAVVFQLGSRDRGAFKVTLQIFDVVPSAAGLFGNMQLPRAL